MTPASSRSRTRTPRLQSAHVSDLALADRRRYIPASLRRLVVRLVPAPALSRLKRLAGSAARIEQRWAQRVGNAAAMYKRRRASDAAGSRCTIVAVGPHTRVALIDDDLSGLNAREQNLQAVCSALADAGVDYFCVRGASDRSAVVGVSSEDRSRVLVALAGLCRRLPAYVSSVGARSESHRLRPGRSPRAWRTLRRAKVTRVTLYRTDRRGLLVQGSAYGCDVEFWERRGERLVEPRPNLAAADVDASAPSIEAPPWMFTRLVSPHGRTTGHVRTRRELALQMPDDIGFAIDMVYAWPTITPSAHADGSEIRGSSDELLRYSLRALHMYAPWVRFVYVLVDELAPSWLEPSAPQLRLVQLRGLGGHCSQSSQEPDAEYLLNQIEGLSEFFVYVDHAAFFATDVSPDLFFYGNGISKLPTWHPGEQRPNLGPHALRRDVLVELAGTNPISSAHRPNITSQEQGSGTALRDQDRAFATGRAAPADDLHRASVNLASRHIRRDIRRVTSERDHHVVALHGDHANLPIDARNYLRHFLDASFPAPSPFERVSV